MSRGPGVFIFMVLSTIISHAVADQTSEVKASPNVHAFYYGWYGTPQIDGRYSNWNHPVSGAPGRKFPGGDDIGANFYPKGGCYSPNDKKTLDRQMQELRSAGIGVLVASWWGRDSFTDQNLPRLLDAAAAHGLQVAIHIEPFKGRNALTTREAIKYLIDRHGEHAGWYRAAELGNRPMFYVYDSYLTPPKEWAEVLKVEGAHTLRGTKFDAVVIGLWVFPWDGLSITRGGFDGFYTYFGCEGFSYGSTVANWPTLARFAERNHLLFIPSVAPGYEDTRIRPMNGRNSRQRQRGAFYDRMFAAAIDTGSKWVSITSYNEWHEGTQIEPAMPKKIDSFTYEDYSPDPPDFYLRRTKDWVARFEATQKASSPTK